MDLRTKSKSVHSELVTVILKHDNILAWSEVIKSTNPKLSSQTLALGVSQNSLLADYQNHLVTA